MRPSRSEDCAASFLSTSHTERDVSWRGAGTAGGVGAADEAFQEPKAFSSAGRAAAVTSPTTTSEEAPGMYRAAWNARMSATVKDAISAAPPACGRP